MKFYARNDTSQFMIKNDHFLQIIHTQFKMSSFYIQYMQSLSNIQPNTLIWLNVYLLKPNLTVN